MSFSLEIIKNIVRSKEDENQLKKITYDEENIKNLNYNFKNVVVKKPWGYEYLFFTSPELSIWILKIQKNQKTSMHCHKGKKTSLILLEGEANVYTLNGTLKLKSGNIITIDQGAFHRTSSEFDKDILVMEIETPTNKNDIIRLKDEYKRSNSGYETKQFFTKIEEKKLYLNYEDAKKKPVILGNYQICIINSDSNNIDEILTENLLFPIKTNIEDDHEKKKLGEIYNQNLLKDKSSLFAKFQEFLVIKQK